MLWDAERNRPTERRAPTDVRAMDGKAFSKGYWTKLLGIITQIVLRWRYDLKSTLPKS